MSEATEQSLKRLPRFKPRSGLVVMYASIRALFLRELQTRFGHYRIGYLWALLEPGMIIALKLILFNTIRDRVTPGIEFSVFLVAGVCAFYMIMRSMTKNLNVVASNKGLYSYKSVKPIDSIIARAFLECCLYFFCFIVFLSVLVWFGFEISFSQIPLILLTWIILFFLSLGLGLIMAVLGDFSPEIGKFISGCMIILYLMSGLLFSINTVPERFLPYILWNPIVHGLEYIRWALAPTYSIQYVSYSYLCIATIVVLFIGLLLYKARERDMLRTK